MAIIPYTNVFLIELPSFPITFIYEFNENSLMNMAPFVFKKDVNITVTCGIIANPTTIYTNVCAKKLFIPFIFLGCIGFNELITKDFLFTTYFCPRKIIVVMNTIIALKAAAKFACPPTSLMNSEYINTGITWYPSPISIGVPKSANAFINTNKLPASTVGKINGITTVNTFFTPVHPKLSDASIRETSSFFNAPVVYIYIKGNNFNVNTNNIPEKPYMLGKLIPNVSERNVVITPLLPRSKIQE